MVIHVREKQLRVVCKDGRVLNFSHEPQELRDFILCQISQHQVFWEITFEFRAMSVNSPFLFCLKISCVEIPKWRPSTVGI